VPFQYTESRILKARLEFLRETYRIRENDFLSFDAMRHSAQCLGRVLRGKDDYGIMVMADKRFAKKRNQLPKWISSALMESDSNMSVDQSVATAKKFLKTMSKPFPARMQDGISTWTYEDLMRNKGKIDAERQLDMHASGNGNEHYEQGDHAMADVQAADGMEVDAEFDAAMNEMADNA
jgi:DNA excision repair protein ERCC-2